MSDPLLQSLFRESNLSEDDFSLIAPCFTKISPKRGSHVLSQGDPVLHTHYVLEGCLRTYYIDSNGREHTLQFAIKDWWISDYTAFFTGGKAMMNIECIQDTTLYRLSRKDMKTLYNRVPSFESFFRMKLEKRVTAFHKRTLGNLALTARERYLSFVATYPDIEKQIKNYHIASFLGITTESLSRIRKEIST